ncbi:type II secretion system F family protein [Patescibacteria group bacterium]|nr:type II secretion system F family protein [Patescibacteria group bacterium]
MKFNYIARTEKGNSQSGAIEATDKSSALDILQSKGLLILKITSAEKTSFFVKEFKFFQRIKRRDVFIFFRQLAILVDADVPLVQSLKILGDQEGNSQFKEIILEIAAKIDGGASFSKSLSDYPKLFSSFAVNLAKTGEISGGLKESLEYLAEHLEKEYYLISKVRGAMAYPGFILGAFAIAGILVMTMVIPNLTSILTESGQELPWSTKLVIFSSDVLRNYGWLLFLLLVGLSIFVWKYNQSKEGKAQIDAIKLKIPIFGKILQKTYLARLAESLSVLIKGGVSIVEALNISSDVVGNAVFAKIILQARDDVKIGKAISSSFENYEEIPPMFNQMIRTGEKTGKIESILGKLSVFYNKEVENVVNNLSQIIEPLLLILLGIAVAILVFAVFMPIYGLAGTI